MNSQSFFKIHLVTAKYEDRSIQSVYQVEFDGKNHYFISDDKTNCSTRLVRGSFYEERINILFRKAGFRTFYVSKDNEGLISDIIKHSSEKDEWSPIIKKALDKLIEKDIFGKGK